MVKACACVDELTATPPISPAVEEVNFSEFLISEDEHRVIKKVGGGAATRYCLVQYELKGFPVNTEPLTLSVVNLWWIYKYHPPNQSPNHG